MNTSTTVKPPGQEVVHPIADVVSNKDQDRHGRIASPKVLENPDANAKEAIPDLKESLPKIDGAAGPTDENPDQAGTAAEEFHAVTDGTNALGPEEIDPYNRLISWVKNQSFVRLDHRAEHGLQYTDLYEQPAKHRGKLVALDLDVRRTRSVGKNQYGVQLYEVWATTQESGGRVYDLIVLDYPKGMSRRDDIRHSARFAGYFLKLKGYEPGDAGPGQRPEKAPLLIGRLEWMLSAEQDTPPQTGDKFTRDVPPGLRDGINRLSQGLQERNDLTGNFNDYELIVPPNYKGDETKYEIGFLHPGTRLYVFRTDDGGQTWSPFPPTNPYLKKIGHDLVEEARGKVGNGGTPGADHPTLGPEATPPGTETSEENPLSKGSLSGTWQEPEGAIFRINDDGKTATVQLIQGRLLETFSGQLTRRNGESSSKSLTGIVDAVFRPDAPKRHSIHVTATIDDSNHLRLHCSDWPIWTKKGSGKKTLTVTWTRSNGASAQHGYHKNRLGHANNPFNRPAN